MNKQQLANKIWESKNKMCSKIEANEYKDYILGFIFYKYLSDKEIKFLKENDITEEDIKALKEDDAETVKYIQENVGYFISYNALFSTWLERGRNFDVLNVRDALSAFSRLIYASHNKVFGGVFDTLQTGLSKYDRTSGSGSLLINIGRNVSKYINDSNNIKYYAQELKENTYNLTHMNFGGESCFSDAKKYKNDLGRTKLALNVDRGHIVKAKLVLLFY